MIEPLKVIDQNNDEVEDDGKERSKKERSDDELAKALFKEELMDIDNDDSPLDLETHRMLSKYDDPWENLKDPHVMMTFYKSIFPWKLLFLWLNQDHVPNYNFTNREFAVTLQNDAYLRYNSYSNHLDLQKDMIRLNPSRFEIGAVYSVQPKDKKSIPKSAFKPILRELVFDIDLTDYDDIRKCCSDKKICKKCWKFISIAVKVLEKRLRNDFGFKHLLWVYSGRRGIHCWISDEEALRLNDDQRRSIVNYLDIFRGGGHSSKSGLKVDLKRPFHPSIEESFEIIKPYFKKVALTDQEVFKGEDRWKFFTSLWISPQKKIFSDVEAALKNLTSESPSALKWEAVVDFAPTLEQISSSKVPKDKNIHVKEICDNLIFQYTYPRIDLEVSKHMNHLLKSPFCVHPGTGKVCIPLDPEKIEEFDPEKVPDVRDLLRELDRFRSKQNQQKSSSTTTESVGENLGGIAGGGGGGGHSTNDENYQSSDHLSKAWSKTSLRTHVEFFERHVNNLIKLKTKIKKETKKQTNSMEF